MVHQTPPLTMLSRACQGSCWSPFGSVDCSTPCPSWPPTCRWVADRITWFFSRSLGTEFLEDKHIPFLKNSFQVRFGIRDPCKRMGIPGSSRYVKFLPFGRSFWWKGTNFTHLEDPGMYLYIVCERSHGLETRRLKGILWLLMAIGQLKFFFSAIYARTEAQSDGGGSAIRSLCRFWHPKVEL